MTKIKCDSCKHEFEAERPKAVADMCFTDPPYGVSYKGTNNPNGRDWGVMNGDDLRKDDLFNFLLPIYKNIFKHTKDKAALYSCYASSNHIIFENALMEAGFRVKQQLIWSKGHVLGHSDYHWCHEPILYCVKKDENSEWYGDRTHKTMLRDEKIDLKELNKEQLLEILTAIQEQSDVIEIQKDASQTYLHPTQKPVALSRGMIKNSSRPNELVLEPCSGSGSTLMACETGNRTCYAMEISPAFVDVAVKRWEDYTGQKGRRE